MSRLLHYAGVSDPVGTAIRQGSQPRPETCRKLAQAMNLPYEDVLRAARYDEDEIQRLVSDERPVQLSSRETELLANFRVLPDPAQRTIFHLVELMLQQPLRNSEE